MAAYPLVPKDEVGFRIQVTAANGDDEIEQLCDVLVELNERFDLQHDDHRGQLEDVPPEIEGRRMTKGPVAKGLGHVEDLSDAGDYAAALVGARSPSSRAIRGTRRPHGARLGPREPRSRASSPTGQRRVRAGARS